MLEEQKRLSEGRYRSLLLEAIQDAVYLSSQNQQLQADNMQLLKGDSDLLRDLLDLVIETENASTDKQERNSQGLISFCFIISKASIWMM